VNRLRIFFRDRRGTAAVEFALISVFLFSTLVVALDFGFFVQQRLKLGGAVEQAAILAYNKQIGTSTTPSTTSLRDYVQNYSGLKIAPTATVTCNGGGSAVCGDGKCSCITSTGGFTVTACNATCPTNTATAGNYLKISASATYSAVIVPDKYLNNAVMTQVAVVRLQ
jgi:Flp pilus assembly protein TadG